MKAGQVGRMGEDIAFRILKKKGYKILGRSVTTPSGELDVVAREGRTIVFVEVKTRTSDAFGRPEEAVDLRKQRRLVRLAREWLSANRLADHEARFDVVSVWLDQAGRRRVEIVRNAFEARD